MTAPAVAERTVRVARAVRDCGADWAVLTDPGSVCYATGHVVPIEAGPSPFAGGPTVALVGADGTTAVVAANVEPALPAALDHGVRYAGFGYAEPIDSIAAFAAAIDETAAALGIGGVLAIEPVGFTATLSARLVATGTVAITPALDRARAIKTPGEIALLTAAAAAAAAGQHRAIAATRAGRTELTVFAKIRAAIEHAAGERVAMAGDYLSGIARTTTAAGWPIGRTIAPGDPVICDLAPRIAGYWGDSCGSFCVGEPGAAYSRLFRASADALACAIDSIRPGLSIAALDRRLRDVVASHGFAYPHHSGHSIGASVHEHPRIVPHATGVLEAGMVMMLEPSAYDPAIGGVRLEWMLLVEPDGCRPLAPFPHIVSVG